MRAEPDEEQRRERVHERIQPELYKRAKEAKAMLEEQLEVPPQWNAVLDLMMDSGMEEEMLEANTKRRRDKVAQGRRKWWEEDDIKADK